MIEIRIQNIKKCDKCGKTFKRVLTPVSDEDENKTYAFCKKCLKELLESKEIRRHEYQDGNEPNKDN